MIIVTLGKCDFQPKLRLIHNVNPHDCGLRLDSAYMAPARFQYAGAPSSSRSVFFEGQRLPRSRMTGMLAGIRELIPRLPDEKARFLDGEGRFEDSLVGLRKYRARTKSTRILLGALNDPSCLGGLHAFEEAGRPAHCLRVGQNASIEARREMRRPGSSLVGSVGYFPEHYGEAVISLALDKAEGREVPSATFVKHQMITADNVNIAYPNEALITQAESDSLLFSHC